MDTKTITTMIKIATSIECSNSAGESICKPGFVEDSHSSTTAITGRL